jgi:hypothetical protein
VVEFTLTLRGATGEVATSNHMFLLFITFGNYPVLCPITFFLMQKWVLFKSVGGFAERIRLDCESEANHNLNRLLDKPGLSYRKYLFGDEVRIQLVR